MLNHQSYNVIAQTKGGDPNNVLVLTAHTDSVIAGNSTVTPIFGNADQVTFLTPRSGHQ